MNFWEELKKPFSVLAPMEDVTDVVFRQVIAECGAPDVFFTEFTNTDALATEGRESALERLRQRDGESPLVAQVWGSRPENYRKAAQEIVQMGFAGIDINMGCPAKNVTKSGHCSALIDNPKLAGEIIKATQEGTGGKIPVSVKTRMGFRSNRLEEWTTFLLEQNIDALTMHGRLAKDMSKYPADWDAIRRVVKMKNDIRPETIIIGNGDVLSLEEVKQKHEETGVDGVMIGRGVFLDPFVFNPTRSLRDLTLEERAALLWRHATLFVDTWGGKKPFQILRRFFKIYVQDFPGAKELRNKLTATDSLEEVRFILSSHIR